MGIKSFFSTPKRQAFVILLLVVVLYAYTARPIEFANRMALSEDYIYLTTKRDGLRIIDVSDRSTPQEVGYYDTRGIAGGLHYQDNRVFVSDGRQGVLILDVSDPASPQKQSSYNTPGFANDVYVEGKRIYVADGRSGLRVLEYTRPETGAGKIEEIGSLELRADLFRIIKSGDILYIGDRGNKLWAVDVSKPREPVSLGSINVSAKILDIQLYGNTALLAADKRGVIAVDISDPSTMTEQASLPLNGTASGIWIDDIYAYVATGRNDVKVIDISNSSTLNVIGSIATPGVATDVLFSDGYVYITDGFEGLRVEDAIVLLEPRLVGESSPQLNVEDVFVTENYAYLAAGERGLRVIDITTPNAPREVNFYDTPGYARSVSVEGDVAFVADGSQGVQFIDISDASQDLRSINRINIGNDANDLVASQGILYLAEGSEGLRVISYTPLDRLGEVGNFDSPGNALGLALWDEYIYLADGGAGLRIINVSDPAKPTPLGFLETPGDAQDVVIISTAAGQSGQSGGVQEGAVSQSANNKLYAMLADGSGGLRVIDVTNPKQPKEVAVFEKPDYVQGLSLQGNSLFMALREGGFAILDVSNPSAPKEVGGLDTPGKASALAIQDDYVYIADFDRGMQVVDVSNPEKPVLSGFYDAPAKVRDVATFGSYAYIVDGEKGMWVQEISNANKPKEIGFFATPGEANRIILFQNTALIADGSKGLQIIDISDPNSPYGLGSYDTPGNAEAVVAFGTQAFIADGSSGMIILDFSDPRAIRKVGSLDTPGEALGIAVTGKYAYIADGARGLKIVNIASPEKPVEDSVFSDATDARAVTVDGNFAYVADGVNGLRIVDVTLPLVPKQIKQFDTPGTLLDVYLVGIYAFLADGNGGIWILDVSDPGQPIQVGFNNAPGTASGITAVTQAPEQGRPVRYWIYAAYDESGLRVFEGEKGISHDFISLYETPGTASIQQMLVSAVPVILGDEENVPGKVSRTIAQVRFEVLILGGLGLLFWIAMISQFVLPFHTIRERLSAFVRMIFFMLGRHGPAIAIEEGKTIQRPGEEDRHGPGVIRVDLGSAVVLERRQLPYPFILGLGLRAFHWVIRRVVRRPVRQMPTMRIEGPGIVFTRYQGFPRIPRYYEVLRDVADLRPQIRIEPGVKGNTRDGIELTTNIFTIFTLGQEPDILLVTYIDEKKETDSSAKEPDTQTGENDQGEGVPTPVDTDQSDEGSAAENQLPDWKRSADNLRVVTLEPVPRIITENGVKRLRTYVRVKKISDELDVEDKAEIHNYVQRLLRGGVLQPYTIYEAAPRPPAPFVFNRTRVFSALASKAIDVKGKEKYMRWDTLPNSVAVDIFREMLNKQAYDHLYEEPGNPKEFPLPELKNQFRTAIRNLGVLSFRYIERVDGKPLDVIRDKKDGKTDQKTDDGSIGESELLENQLKCSGVRELRNPKVLRLRGIKVLASNFTEFKPDEEVRQQRLDNWRARWQQDTEITRATRELEATRVRTQARAQAQKEMGEILSKIFNDQPRSIEALALRVYQAMERVATDMNTRQLLPSSTLDMLRNIRQLFIPDRIGPGIGMSGKSLPPGEGEQPKDKLPPTSEGPTR